MKPSPAILTKEALEDSKTVPGKIRSYLIAKNGRFLIKYVEWEPRVMYPGHTDLEEAYIFLIQGDISTGALTLKDRMVAKFHKGFYHEGMKTRRGARFILIRPPLRYEKAASTTVNTVTLANWIPANLRKSEKYPDKIQFGPIAKLGNHVIEYVTWQPGTVFPDHVNLSKAHIHLIKGEISDGSWAFKAGTTITFPKGFRHQNERTEKGAEFVLIWEDYPSINWFPAVES